MCRSISLLSGKGGSGKTTLALSIASMLSSCGIKVLLIDCDLSTNGATYFYEDKLAKQKKQITSFYDILFKNQAKNTKVDDYNFVSINDSYDFLPSITKITKKNNRIYTFKNDGGFTFYNNVKDTYDVILFDCQAGYTDVLKLILPIMDINLVVMEADAISSAAIRSLYLKIGDDINEKNIYQVFNKASQEEYDIYSKVSGGTAFTNIETIKFDWKIRKAFSVKQIPDMENTSASYGEQIYSICSILFPNDEIKEKLKTFITLLKIHRCKEEELRVQNTLTDLKRQYKSRNKKAIRSVSYIFLLMICIAFCVVFFFGVENHLFNNNIIFVPIIMSLLTLVVSFINIFDVNKDKKDFYKDINKAEMQLKNIEYKKQKLQQNLGDIIKNLE